MKNPFSVHKTPAKKIIYYILWAIVILCIIGIVATNLIGK